MFVLQLRQEDQVLDMAAATPTSSTSRRPRDPAQPDVEIGSFRRMEEIGRGSFATVYKATHTVSMPSFLLDKLCLITTTVEARRAYLDGETYPS